MIPKKPAPHLMRGGYRFSKKIMLQDKEKEESISPLPPAREAEPTGTTEPQNNDASAPPTAASTAQPKGAPPPSASRRRDIASQSLATMQRKGL
jgi:hypothetical protein